MKKIILLPLLLLLFGFSSHKVQGSSGRLFPSSPGFIKNEGQLIDAGGGLHPEVLFTSFRGNTGIFLRKNGLSYVMTQPDPALQQLSYRNPDPEKAMDEVAKEALVKFSLTKMHRVDIEFSGAKTSAFVKCEEKNKFFFNYYLGHCPLGITNVQSYNKVVIENIYDNIDVVLYGDRPDGMEYDFVVRPGGNPSDIHLKYSGTQRLSLYEGSLLIGTSLGDIQEKIPSIYQDTPGGRKNISGAYALDGNVVSVKVGEYDRSSQLIIDPTWLLTTGGSYGGYVATDAAEDAIVVGSAFSATFPVTAGTFQTVLNGSYDAGIAKYDLNGTLLWATFYGGGSVDYGYGVTTDQNSNIFVSGTAYSTDFPCSAGAHQTSYGGGSADAFLVKLDGNNGTRMWGTYYGGGYIDEGYDVNTDALNNVFMTGPTRSYGPLCSSCIATVGAYNTQGWTTTSDDAFVVKFNSTGTRQWGTYIAGGNADEPYGVVIDGNEDVYVTGWTYSTNFPTLSVSGGYNQMTKAGYYDAFLVKLNSGGTARVFSTYYGGSSGGTAADYSYDIAADASNNVMISGKTFCTNFPVSAGCWQAANGSGLGGADAFLVKFSSAGARLWGTYFGGSGNDESHGVDTDPSGNIVLAGSAQPGGGVPVSSCAFQTTYYGTAYEYFMASFDPSGTLICASYWGANAGPVGPGGTVAIPGSASGEIYMAGEGITLTREPLSCGCILPVEFLSFTVHNEDGANVLTWSLATERNNSHFIVERSRDGESFHQIGIEKGAGNSDSRTDYVFKDINPFPDRTYYRLRQVDNDGQFSYSETISIANQQSTKSEIYPVPASCELNCAFYAGENSVTSFMITDLMGNNLLKEKVKSLKGLNKVMLNINALPCGFYFLSIDNGYSREQMKFVKK